MDFSAFQEPRGVMRVIQFVFSICAFATVTGYSGTILFKCLSIAETESFGYPFDFHFHKPLPVDTKNTTKCDIFVTSASTSDAKFFVATGVLAMLYALIIIAVYAKFDEKYKSDTRLPLIDFLMTVLLGVLWLSSSAAWANGLSGLKESTNPPLTNPTCTSCSVTSGSFTSLTISVLLGFLNFFLWAADLWFVYKETSWFQGNQPQPTSGV